MFLTFSSILCIEKVLRSCKSFMLSFQRILSLCARDSVKVTFQILLRFLQNLYFRPYRMKERLF